MLEGAGTILGGCGVPVGMWTRVVPWGWRVPQPRVPTEASPSWSISAEHQAAAEALAAAFVYGLNLY